MNFSSLTFEDHAIKGATKARHTFPNGWAVSVVSGPKDSGLYGVISEDTFEVAVYRPNGKMLEDVLSWQTPVQITSLMHLIEMLWASQLSTLKHTNSTIVMNIQAFNSSELDLIYDLIFERLGCTDSDKESRDCNTIISKMHMFCTMNEDWLQGVNYKELLRIDCKVLSVVWLLLTVSPV